MTSKRAALIVIALTFFSNIFFLPAPSFAALVPVHKSYSLAPKGSTSVNVVANGARYRFIVSITPGGHTPNPDGGYVYATDGYKYEQSSIAWTVTITDESNVGVTTIENEESANNYLKSLQWQTPILNKFYQVKVTGKRWPYNSSGGSGGTYNPNWESTSSGTITNPIIYDTALIKEGDEYKAGDEVSVDPSEELTVEAKAKDGSEAIQNSQVTVFWNLKDPAPTNQGTGSLSSSSSTTDATGLATATLTCSNTNGDDHIVAGQDKASSPSSACDSGTAIVGFKVKITTPINTSMNISSAPAMPTPTFHAEITPSSIDLETVTFKWYSTLGFTQHNRTDSHRIPSSGTSDISGNGNWSPQWGELFAGGDVHVYVTASIGSDESQDDTGTYQIKGNNSSNATVKSGCSINEQVVIYKESYPKWCQFNSSPGWPIFGPPNGWGLMQIDNPAATEIQIWNWGENRSEGCSRLASKYSSGLDWPRRMREIYKYTQARDWNSAEERWKEGYQLYNGGHAWVWVLDDPNDKSGPGQWEPNPNCTGYGINAWNIQQDVENNDPPSGW